jgi:hypothetical protein
MEGFILHLVDVRRPNERPVVMAPDAVESHDLGGRLPKRGSASCRRRCSRRQQIAERLIETGGTVSDVVLNHCDVAELITDEAVLPAESHHSDVRVSRRRQNLKGTSGIASSLEYVRPITDTVRPRASLEMVCRNLCTVPAVEFGNSDADRGLALCGVLFEALGG